MVQLCKRTAAVRNSVMAVQEETGLLDLEKSSATFAFTLESMPRKLPNQLKMSNEALYVTASQHPPAQLAELH